MRLYHLTLEPFDESLRRGVWDLAAQPLPLFRFHHLQQAPQVLHEVQRPQAPHEGGGGGTGSQRCHWSIPAPWNLQGAKPHGVRHETRVGRTPRLGKGGSWSWQGLSQPNSALVLREGSSSRKEVGWSPGNRNATTCPWDRGVGWAPAPRDEFPRQTVLPGMEHPLPRP